MRTQISLLMKRPLCKNLFGLAVILQLAFGPVYLSRAYADDSRKPSSASTPIGSQLNPAERVRIRAVHTQATRTSDVRFALNEGPSDEQLSPGTFTYTYKNGETATVSCWRGRYLGTIQIRQPGQASITERDQVIDYVAYRDPRSSRFMVRRLFAFPFRAPSGQVLPVYKLENPQVLAQEPDFMRASREEADARAAAVAEGESTWGNSHPGFGGQGDSSR